MLPEHKTTTPEMIALDKVTSELTLTNPPTSACERCLSIQDILDVVFSHHTSQHLGASERGAIALVCRSWLVPAQRSLFSKINTCKIVTPELLSSHLRKYVKSIHFSDPGTRSGWNERGLSRLLLSLPNLKVLKIELYKAHLMMADYRYLGPFEKVESLSLESKHFNQGLDSYREIISACPNIRSLTLSHAPQYHHHYFEPSDDRFPKVELPNLIHLSLKGVRLIRDFFKLHLITQRTLNQVTRLELSGIGSDPHLGPHFSLEETMESIGPNILSLTLGSFSSQGLARGMLTSGIMTKCPNLKVLKTYEMIDVELIPLSLESLVYLNDPQELLGMMKYRKNEGLSTWKDVKRVYFGLVNVLSEEASQWLREEGVEVTFGDPMNAFPSDSFV